MKIDCDYFRNPHRRNLAEHIPLAAPLKVNIEPSNLCNIACKFCPTSDRKLVAAHRKQGIMSFDLFKKIVSDLGEFGEKINVVEFFMDGEPLINPDFPEMAKYLRKRGIAEVIRVKTNGLLLTPELIDRLIDSHLGRIDISIIAPNSKGYKRIAGRPVNYSYLTEMIRLLWSVRMDTQIYINMRAMPGFTDRDNQKFYEDFYNYSDYIAIEPLHNWSAPDSIDRTFGTEHIPEKIPVVCPWPFYRLAINWNGLVRTCTIDWAWKTTIGDASKESLKSIWNGEQMRQFRRLQLTGHRSENVACNNCPLIYTRLDDLDGDREKLLELI